MTSGYRKLEPDFYYWIGSWLNRIWLGRVGHRAVASAAFGVSLLILGACGFESSTTSSPNILLFCGAGTSRDDVASLKKILKENHFNFETANSWQLNRMGEAKLRRYRLLIVPGGNFERIGNGLTSGTRVKIQNSVNSGLNYFGVCAGAFFAGNSPYNGLNLTSGVRFEFYALENQGVRKSAVEIAIAGSHSLSQYWEDGPQFTGWGDVVAKYPDGTPAIVQGKFGNGGVLLSGVHPEAPDGWKQGLNVFTPDSINHAYAASLITAALNRTMLEHF
jgi:glutamine amidotransferase-like uncharacterized protein